MHFPGKTHLAASCGALAALVMLAACTRAPTPNVLLISIDSLRADHLGTYGYERDTSPMIDRIAREGVRFDNAIAPSSWTLPSHLTLLSSLPPEALRVRGAKSALSDEALTLAEVMRDNGFATAGFVGGPFLRSLYGFGQGFDLYDDETIIAEGPPTASHRGITSPTLVKLAHDWLDSWHRTKAGRPFFLFLHMWDVHYDFAPPPPYDQMFDPHYTGEIDGDNFEKNPAISREMDARDLHHVVALYDGEIRFTDEHLKMVIEKLEGLGVYDDTVVVVTSDHGEEFFEHGVKGHAKALFDESIRVPLIIRYPRVIHGGQTVPELVRLMDVGPTILGLAGIAQPEQFGLSSPTDAIPEDLTPWIRGGGSREGRKTLVAFSESRLFNAGLSSIRTRSFKLIRRDMAKGPRWQAFDLEKDPGEEQGLLRGKRTRAPRLGNGLPQRLTAWIDHWASQDDRFSKPAKVNEKHMSRLRALGYID